MDWSLPENAGRRWVVFHAVKVFEGRTYVDFVRSDLDALLASAGIDVEDRATTIGGIAQIIVGRRSLDRS